MNVVMLLTRARCLVSVLVALLLVACDCSTSQTGGPQSCVRPADCASGQTCLNGRCSAAVDSGLNLDGAVPVSDSALVPIPVSVRVYPPNADVVATDGVTVTQNFIALVTYNDGVERPVVGALFEIDSRALGDIDPSTGIFTANGILGGTVNVTVSISAGGVRLTAMGTLRVRIERDVLATDAPTDIVARFDAALPLTDAARAANIVYPLDRVVFPENVFPADVQWTNAAAGDLFRVRLAKADVTITAYLAYDPMKHWLVDLAGWRSLAQSNPGTDATLTVDRLLATGELIASTPVALTFARAALTGSVYYWDIVAGRIQRIDDGTGTAVSFLPSPDQDCVGCHSVSTNGRYMAGRLGGGDNVGTVYDLTTDLTVSTPSPSIWPPNDRDLNWWFSTWSPDDTRIFVAAQNGPSLRLYDPIAGTSVAATGLDGLTGTYPAWSPDGTRIAYINNNNGNWGDDVRRGDVAILPVTGPDAFGPPVTIHDGSTLPGGSADSYPTWTPDSTQIAFGHGDGSRSETRQGDLFIMGADGSSVTQLTVASSGARDDFQPRFSPFTQGGYFWLSFLSRRIYGNPEIGNSTSAVGRRQQIWVTAVRVGAAATEDPSAVPYWLPGQDPHSANISAFWAPRACRTDGETCSVGSECCGGECLVDDSGALVCAPPPPERCREYGETCSSDSDCCASMGLECSGNVCVTPVPG